MKTEIEILISTGAIIHGVLLRHLDEGGLDQAISIVAKTDEDHKRVKECLKKAFEDAEQSCLLKASHLESLGESFESKPGSELARDQKRPRKK